MLSSVRNTQITSCRRTSPDSLIDLLVFPCRIGSDWSLILFESGEKQIGVEGRSSPREEREENTRSRSIPMEELEISIARDGEDSWKRTRKCNREEVGRQDDSKRPWLFGD